LLGRIGLRELDRIELGVVAGRRHIDIRRILRMVAGIVGHW
jgi:hypothetical protein